MKHPNHTQWCAWPPKRCNCGGIYRSFAPAVAEQKRKEAMRKKNR